MLLNIIKLKKSTCLNRLFGNQSLLVRLTVLLVFGLSTAHGQTTSEPLTLEDVLKTVLEENPILKQAKGNEKVHESKIGVAKSRKYPKMILEGSFTYVDPVSEVNLPLGENPVTLPLFPNDNWDVHAGIQYTLFDFGRTNEYITMAKIEKLIAEEGLEAVQKKLTYAATELFSTILFTEKAIEVQDKLIVSLKRNLKRTNGFIKNGLATKFDRINTNVRITTAQNKKTSLQNNFKRLQYKLKELLGMGASKKLILAGNLSIENMNIPQTLHGKGKHNELAIATYLDSILLSTEKLVNKSNLPFITLGGKTGFHNGYMPNLDEFRFNYAVFTKITVPIFQGFKVKYEKDIAKIKRENSNWHLQEIKTKINTELAYAEQSLEDSHLEYENNKILIQQAEIAVQQARKKYDNQLITNLDLLDTEVVLAAAQLSLLQSEYKYIMAYYKLQQAKGIKIWQQS